MPRVPRGSQVFSLCHAFRGRLRGDASTDGVQEVLLGVELRGAEDRNPSSFGKNHEKSHPEKKKHQRKLETHGLII